MEPMESLDLTEYADTPLALEKGLADDSEWWATAAVAGLQFYSYGSQDELVGEVTPSPGDALSLMRRPDNPADTNAVEVWWRNRFMLGHVPRGIASVLAPEIDVGRSVRAYVLAPGDGEAWSLRAVLCGSGVEHLHGRRLEAVERRRESFIEAEANDGARQVWPEVREAFGGPWRWGWYGSSRPVPAPRPPTEAQLTAAHLFERERDAQRMLRHADLLDAFAAMPPQYPPLPPAAIAAPPEDVRGRTFHRWADVPACLMAATLLREHGLRPRRGAAPIADFVGYSRYSLYAVADCEPLPWHPRRPAEAQRLRRAARDEFVGFVFDA